MFFSGPSLYMVEVGVLVGWEWEMREGEFCFSTGCMTRSVTVLKTDHAKGIYDGSNFIEFSSSPIPEKPPPSYISKSSRPSLTMTMTGYRTRC